MSPTSIRARFPRAGRLLFYGLCLAGCLAWGGALHRAHLHASARAGASIALNPFFFVPNLTTETRLLHAVPEEGFLSLRKGDHFLVRRGEDGAYRFHTLDFDLRLEEGDVEDVYFRVGPTGAYRLRLSRDPTRPCDFAFLPGADRGGGAPVREVLRGKGPWRPRPGRWHHYRLCFDPDGFTLEVDRKRNFRFRHAGPDRGRVGFMTVAGMPSLDNLVLEAVDEGGKASIHEERFDPVPGSGPGAWSSHPLAGFLLALVLAAFFAWWIILPGRCAFHRPFRAALLCFAAVLLPEGARWAGAWDPGPWLPAVLPFLLGLGPGLLFLPRLSLGPLEAGRGFGPRGRRLLPAFLVLAALFLSSWILLSSRWEWRVDRPPPADPPLLKHTLEYAPARALDPSNFFLLPEGEEVVRDFVLEGELRLEPESQVEIYFRRVGYFDRAALQVSTLPEVGCSWLDMTPCSFRQVHPRALPPPPPDRWIPFRVEVRGARLLGRVGAGVLPPWVEGRRAQGRIGFLVNRGKGAVRKVRLVPRPPVEERPPLGLRLRRSGWLAGLFLLCWVLGLAVAGRGGAVPRRLWAALDGGAHLPFAAALALALLGWSPGPPVFAGAAFLTLAARLAPAVANGRRLGWVRVCLLLCFSAAASLAFFLAAREPPSRVFRMNDLKLHDFTPPVQADLAWYQMPRLRRSNLYLEDHRFRERYFHLAKPEDGFRIVCMGSSSTFGHGLPMHSGWDFPFVLEQRLQARYPGRKIEVMNAGIRGADSVVVREFYRGLVRAFHPDLVIIDLYYNDTVYAPVCRAHPYMEALRASGFRQGRFGRWWEGCKVFFRAWIYKRYAHALERGEAVPGFARNLFLEGVESFRKTLEDTVKLVHADGAAVLLVKEPFREGSRGPWSREHYGSAMEAVGRATGAPVVDPLPEFRKRNRPLKEFFIDYVHLNREGCALMAEFLEREIVRLGVIPEGR